MRVCRRRPCLVRTSSPEVAGRAVGLKPTPPARTSRHAFSGALRQEDWHLLGPDASSVACEQPAVSRGTRPSSRRLARPAMEHHALGHRVRRAGTRSTKHAAGSASSCPSLFHLKPAQRLTGMPRPWGTYSPRPAPTKWTGPLGLHARPRAAARPGGAGSRAGRWLECASRSSPSLLRRGGVVRRAVPCASPRETRCRGQLRPSI